MSHRAEEEQLYRQSREVQFIRAASARSPTAPHPTPTPGLRSRGSVSSASTSGPGPPAAPVPAPAPAPPAAGDDLLLSVLQYPVTASAGGGTAYQHRVVTTRSPGAPPPYYPSPSPSRREQDGDESAPGAPPPASLALGGHLSDTDDTDGGNVSDPEHHAGLGRGGFSLHNFGAAMVSKLPAGNSANNLPASPRGKHCKFWCVHLLRNFCEFS
ncbi:Acetamidase regulatory protein [Frankliniella fusca]|uniref:Acetamidase regulatory protein n=1 Tax=Frankliniella fusca TaxID=407009 RepID=A0AAE1HTX2_9NEOP|nr:Acetamidase regulatory protein [Frankliniella fusca]